MRPVYKRVLLKISGEALAAKNGFGFDPAKVDQIAGEIKEVHDAGVEMGIVIGAGNIFRGGTAEGIDRAAGDMIGMLATAINSLVLREYLENRGIDSRVLSAIDIPKAAEFFSSRARFITSKKTALSSSREARAIPISPPTARLRFAAWKYGPKFF